MVPRIIFKLFIAAGAIAPVISLPLKLPASGPYMSFDSTSGTIHEDEHHNSSGSGSHLGHQEHPASGSGSTHPAAKGKQTSESQGPKPEVSRYNPFRAFHAFHASDPSPVKPIIYTKAIGKQESTSASAKRKLGLGSSKKSHPLILICFDILNGRRVPPRSRHLSEEIGKKFCIMRLQVL